MLCLYIVQVCSYANSLLKQVKTGSTPLYNYHNQKLQDLSGSAYVNGHVYLASDGGKNSAFPETRLSSLARLDKPAAILPRRIFQRDIEGATQIEDTIFITSSMSQVNEDTADYRIISAVKVDTAGQLVSERYMYARDIIITALEKKFGDSAWLRRVKVSFGKSGGINVEGLSVSHGADDKLVLGFRSPLWDEKFGSPMLDSSLSLATGQAILMEIDASLDVKSKVGFINLLDLNGQGIRGMEYIPKLKSYVIISGGVEKLNEYHLWLYDPIKETSTKLSQVNDDFSRLCRPESILDVPENNTLIIFSEESGKACANVPFNYIQYEY